MYSFDFMQVEYPPWTGLSAVAPTLGLILMCAIFILQWVGSSRSTIGSPVLLLFWPLYIISEILVLRRAIYIGEEFPISIVSFKLFFALVTLLFEAFKKYRPIRSNDYQTEQPVSSSGICSFT